MTLKIIHTSDWHLGKRLYKKSRIEEQKLFLDWLGKKVVSDSIDALLISGDIFDTPNPPHEALSLYFDFLKFISDSSETNVYIISGNHDSGRFLEAPKSFLKKENIHVVGTIGKNPEEMFFEVKGKTEKAHLLLLPYFRSHDLIALGKDLGYQNEENILTGQEIIDGPLQLLIDRFENWSDKKGGGKKIMMAHHLFGHFTAAGSEQALFLSGLESIPSKIFENQFDYVALGHIHKPQIVKRENPIIYYSGSPIPMRFSEKEKKSIALINIKDESLKFEVDDIPSFRSLLSLKGSLHEINNAIESLDTDQSKLRPFAEVIVKLEGPEIGLADKYRALFQEKGIELVSLHTELPLTESENEKLKLAREIGHVPSPTELFETFYQLKYPSDEKIPEGIYQDFLSLLQDVEGGSSSINEESP